MRALGIDVGRRRIGLAISDVSATIARPLQTLTLKKASTAQAVTHVAAAVETLAAEEDGLSAIVVGMPSHLDGTASRESGRVADFIAGLKRRTSIPIVEEDERLTSHEAESRLAVGEPDWRKRKSRLDSAAAAIILQDYLDRQRS